MRIQRRPERGLLQRRNLDLELLESLARSWVVARYDATWNPPTDVYEVEEGVVVVVEIAGVNPDELKVEVSDHVLTVSGHRPEPTAVRSYQQMEIQYGNFVSEVYIPWTLEEEGIEAEYRDGFLIISLRKALPRRVQVHQSRGGS